MKLTRMRPKMKQRLEDFLKEEAELGCEHCIHHGSKGCKELKCWKLTDEHFRNHMTKYFDTDNAIKTFLMNSLRGHEMKNKEANEENN